MELKSEEPDNSENRHTRAQSGRKNIVVLRPPREIVSLDVVLENISYVEPWESYITEITRSPVETTGDHGRDVDIFQE